MFHVVRRVGGGGLWANLALLLCLSLFPFTTAWVDDSRFARTPIVLYGLNFMAAALAYFILQKVIIRTEGPGSALRQALGKDFKGKFSPVVYLIGIIAALKMGTVGIVVAVASYVAVAIMWIVPDRRMARLVNESEHD
ncbi:hypothetical protein COUCH_25680 [Couchioplanes caeruleus]|uniref:hypothetical protein n=1 Tax=Couchioplanes caeruleus TaxID=56438 RepID=UPI0020BD8535|nr:hypothetical protein [Couchioplanes caeruleus]UQU62412.1 hypothetical protein COUCH_25680 [Couchioplanes caeruleus]